MILMYLYRVETENIEELEFYMETQRFREYGIKRDELPSWFLTLSPEKLRATAYNVIGKEAP